MINDNDVIFTGIAIEGVYNCELVEGFFTKKKNPKFNCSSN